MFEWEVAIFGPPDTLYQGGYFKVSRRGPPVPVYGGTHGHARARARVFTRVVAPSNGCYRRCMYGLARYAQSRILRSWLCRLPSTSRLVSRSVAFSSEPIGAEFLPRRTEKKRNKKNRALPRPRYREINKGPLCGAGGWLLNMSHGDMAFMYIYVHTCAYIL